MLLLGVALDGSIVLVVFLALVVAVVVVVVVHAYWLVIFELIVGWSHKNSRISTIKVFDCFFEAGGDAGVGLEDHEGYKKQVSVEVGEALLLGGDAPEPGEHDCNEEGGEGDGELEVGGGDGLDDCDVGVVGDCLGELVDLEHVDQHLVQLHEVQLPEVVSLVFGGILGDVLHAEVLDGSAHVPLEEVHGDEDAAVEDVERHFIEALIVLEGGEELSAELADVVDEGVDEVLLVVGVVGVEDGGELVGDAVELGLCLVEGDDEFVVEGLVDVAVGVEGVGSPQVEVVLKQPVLRPHQVVDLADDCF